MSFYVYMLESADGSIYAGHTDNLEARLAAHHQGTFRGYTSSRRPVELIFAEMFGARDDAFRREREIKGWTRAKKMALARSDWRKLVQLSQRHQPQSR